MSVAAWNTATLGDLQAVGLANTPAPNTIRTKMDVGPDKIRRRATTTVREVQIPSDMRGDQYQALLAFYETTLKSGSLPFTWEDPVNDAASTTYRFTEPPDFILTVAADDDENRWYRGVLYLEIIA